MRKLSSLGSLRPALLGGAIAALLCLPAAPAAAQIIAKPIKPLFKVAPERGFIDDALAFDASGQRLAYIHSDSATFLDVIVLGVPSWKQELKIAVAGATKVPHRLLFSADGTRLIFIWADTRSGKQGVQLFDLTKNGKLLKEVKDASKIAVVEHGGQQVIAVATEKQDRKGNNAVTLGLHRLKDLKRLKRAALQVGSDNLIKRPPVRLLYWDPGMVQLVGMKKGKYDKKRDVRLPDIATRWDLARKKEIWSAEPKDLVLWNRALTFRNSHPGQYRFVHVGESQQNLFLSTRNNDLSKVKVPVKWGLYEPRSLKQRESWDGKTLYFSLTIDTVNAEAVARKKADAERADLYSLDASGTLKSLGRIFTDKRRFGWAVGGERFAYLRKLKGFGRGGKALEIYPLGAGVQ